MLRGLHAKGGCLFFAPVMYTIKMKRNRASIPLYAWNRQEKGGAPPDGLRAGPMRTWCPSTSHEGFAFGRRLSSQKSTPHWISADGHRRDAFGWWGRSPVILYAIQTDVYIYIHIHIHPYTIHRRGVHTPRTKCLGVLRRREPIDASRHEKRKKTEENCMHCLLNER